MTGLTCTVPHIAEPGQDKTSRIEHKYRVDPRGAVGATAEIPQAGAEVDSKRRGRCSFLNQVEPDAFGSRHRHNRHLWNL
jgi:hypothetical protein